VSDVLVQSGMGFVSVGSHEQFVFLNSARDVEKWTATGKLFQTEVW